MPELAKNCTQACNREKGRANVWLLPLPDLTAGAGCAILIYADKLPV